MSKITLFIFGFLIGCIFIFLVQNLMFDDGYDKWVNIHSYNMKCPDKAYSEIQASGSVSEIRRILSCKLRHGKFTDWKDDKLVIEGQFENGMKVGVWYWYGVDGKVEKTLDFDIKDESSDSASNY